MPTRIPNAFHKYEHIVNVLLQADVGADPAELAAEARRRRPQGRYDDFRICEDINRVLRRSGQFTEEKVLLTGTDLLHVFKMKEDMKVRGVWTTR